MEVVPYSFEQGEVGVHTRVNRHKDMDIGAAQVGQFPLGGDGSTM